MFKQAMMALAGAAALGVGFAGSAEAITVNEITDFGNSVGTEFFLPEGTTEVLGTNFGAEDGDLLRFAFDTLTTATISLDFFTGDANLLLFNGAGNPLFGDDDAGPGFDSEISFTFDPGEYLVGIGRNNFAGFDANGNEIIDNDHDLCEPNPICNEAGILAFVDSETGSSGGPSHDYRLTFSVPTSAISTDPTPVPEPASILGLVAISAVAAGGALKKKVAA